MLSHGVNTEGAPFPIVRKMYIRVYPAIGIRIYTNPREK